MEGMLCRKQEMEAFGKKAANRYGSGRAVLWPLQSLPLQRLPQNLFLNRWGGVGGALQEESPLGKG